MCPHSDGSDPVVLGGLGVLGPPCSLLGSAGDTSTWQDRLQRASRPQAGGQASVRLPFGAVKSDWIKAVSCLRLFFLDPDSGT